MSRIRSVVRNTQARLVEALLRIREVRQGPGTTSRWGGGGKKGLRKQSSRGSVGSITTRAFAIDAFSQRELVALRAVTGVNRWMWR